MTTTDSLGTTAADAAASGARKLGLEDIPHPVAGIGEPGCQRGTVTR